MEAWLETFGDALQPELLLFEAGSQIVGACILVWRRQWVRGWLPLRRVYLNCAGEGENLYIEYNALVAHPAWEEAAAQALAVFLQGRGWDELVLPGISAQPVLWKLRSGLGREEVTEDICRYVDLARLRRDAASFDSALSSNTRQQIRRSQRLYEEAHGPCSVHPAQTAGEAAAMCAELAQLHTAAWQDRGKTGAFDSPGFMAFHRTLIRGAFPAGGAQVLRVAAGEETLGLLYYFVYRARVYFYQSGFRYAADNRLKPGLLAHYLAIRYYLEQSTEEEYDFLAGDSQYKRSLANASRVLYWSSVRRQTIPTLLFYGLRSLKDRYADMVAKRSRTSESPLRARE